MVIRRVDCMLDPNKDAVRERADLPVISLTERMGDVLLEGVHPLLGEPELLCRLSASLTTAAVCSMARTVSTAPVNVSDWLASAS